MPWLPLLAIWLRGALVEGGSAVEGIRIPREADGLFEFNYFRHVYCRHPHDTYAPSERSGHGQCYLVRIN